MSKIHELKAGQREQADDSFIVEYDYINDDGDKIRDNSYTHPEYGEVEEKINLTNLFQTSLSTTTNVGMLVAEAELLEEGRIGERSNPHIPATMDVLEQAKDRIEARDLTPAWTIFESSDVEASGGEAAAD